MIYVYKISCNNNTRKSTKLDRKYGVSIGGIKIQVVRNFHGPQEGGEVELMLFQRFGDSGSLIEEPIVGG